MKQHAYRAYLLRCWQNDEPGCDQAPRWHFSLEVLPERRRQGFDSLEALIGFLREQFNLRLKDEEGEHK